MTPNDESVLTAYLDGELEPDQRSALESVLMMDVDLARQLRGLAEVRTLVAGLPRPSLPVDLAGAVAARIEARSLSDRLHRLLPQRPVGFHAAAIGGLTVAASLIFAALVVRPPARPAPPQAAVRSPATPALPVPPVANQPASPVELLASGPAPALDPARLARKREDAADAEKVRALLDSPRLRRVLIVTDIIGEGTLDRVEELVQKTPRTDAVYGRITVSQGIVIDPLHPSEATVFALVMNDQELDHFRKKLEQSFPKAVEEAEPDPIVVAQLGEVGGLTVLPGTPASSVVIPSTVSPRIALRSDESLQQPAMETRVAAEFGRADLAAAAAASQTQGPVAANRVESATAAGNPPDMPTLIVESLKRIHDPPEIVLVWVTPS
jgi:hypothetical protein